MKIREWTDADAKIRDEIFDAALKHGGCVGMECGIGGEW